MKFVMALIAALLSAAIPIRADSFLILPFFNLSKTANVDWIGESLSETVREALASEGIIALDRDVREEAYKRLSIRPYSLLTRASVMRVAESLDAEQVIFGTFEVIPAETPESPGRGSLRINAQVINLRKAMRGPEYSELGSLEDLARLQSHLAWQTLKMVLPEAAPSEEQFRASQPILRVDAIESYIRGLLASSSDLKLKLFGQAARIEPTYSQANFELGRLHLQKKTYRMAAEHFQRVTPADIRYREANFLLGLCHYYAGAYDKAEQAFRVVAEAVPLNEVWNNLGAAQSRKNSAEALVNFRKALDGDLNDPDYHFNVGYVLFNQGNLDEAARSFRAVLDRDPDDAEAITMLGRCLKKVSGSRQLRSDGMERLKETYEEAAYWQLKAVLEPKR